MSSGFFSFSVFLFLPGCATSTTTDTATTTTTAADGGTTTTTTADGTTTTAAAGATTTTSASATTTTTTAGGTTTTTASTTTTTINHLSATWSLSAVSTTGDVGNESKIKVDSSGKVHIVHFYGTSGLQYTTNVSGSFVNSSLFDTDIATRQNHSLSLAIDSSDGLHIAYFDSSYNLKYAYKASGSSAWTKTTLDSGVGAAGSSNVSAIAVDSGGNPHILFQDIPNNRIKYISKSGSSWGASTVVTSATMSEGALAFDSNDQPHVIYLTSLIYYATKSGGTWSVSSPAVDSGYTMAGIALAVDSSNDVHAVWSRYYDNVPGYIQMHGKKSGSWTPEIVRRWLGTAGGGFASLVIDRGNNIFATSFGKGSAAGTSSSIKLTGYVNGSWETISLGSDSSGGKDYSIGKFNSIAQGPDSRLHISFYHGYGEDLWYGVEQ